MIRRRSEKIKLGPLGILTLILVTSGALRFFGGPAQAIARELAAHDTTSAGAHEPLECETAPDIARVLAALNERETSLDQRETSVSKRAAQLFEAEQKIKSQIIVLEDAEMKLQATLALADNAADGDITQLTSVYENMKPKEASRLFEEMAPSFAAGFLARMRPDAAAKIIEGLSSEVAYSISVVLAGRHSDVPTE